VSTLFRTVLLLSTLLLNVDLQARGPEVGKAAPALQATLLDGSQFRSADQTGQVIILNFWATWCAPCRAEMPALDAYYQKYRDEGLNILAISMDDPEDEAKVRQVMAGFSFPAAMARNANFKDYGRIWRIPLTFVIDRGGILRKDGWYGGTGIDLPMLEKTVTPLLGR
jgi:thiol-disulfide isomerase/thioredoxin